MAVKTQTPSTQKIAATKSRTFRSFLLMAQFEAKEIGQRIAEARTLAGLTQEQLAEMASFSKRSLQDYETGVTIPYKHMAEISRLLAREVEWFLHGEAPIAADRLEELEAKVAKVLTAVELLTERVEALASPQDATVASPARRPVRRKSSRAG